MMNTKWISFAFGILKVIVLAASFGIPFIVVDHGMAPIGFIMLRIGMNVLRPTGYSRIDFVLNVATLIGWFGWILIMRACWRNIPKEYLRQTSLGTICVFVSWLIFVISSQAKGFPFVTSLPFVIFMCIHAGTLWRRRTRGGDTDKNDKSLPPE